LLPRTRAQLIFCGNVCDDESLPLRTVVGKVRTTTSY
jgi:hypothetical protein